MRCEFKSATQIYVIPIYFELQQICIPTYLCKFPFWIQICNPNLCKSHTFWNTANIEKWPFFAPDDQNWWNRKNCPKFFHRVIFALWIQICNPNLCKSHIFWITANIEKWSFFCIPGCKSHTFWNTVILKTGLFSHTFWPKLMIWWPKSDVIKKIARNSFIG